MLAVNEHTFFLVESRLSVMPTRATGVKRGPSARMTESRKWSIPNILSSSGL